MKGCKNSRIRFGAKTAKKEEKIRLQGIEASRVKKNGQTAGPAWPDVLDKKTPNFRKILPKLEPNAEFPKNIAQTGAQPSAYFMIGCYYLVLWVLATCEFSNCYKVAQNGEISHNLDTL